MSIQELEQKLQEEVSPNIVIVDLQKFNVKDIMGVRYNDPKSGKQLDVCACPANDVQEERNESYTDDWGRPHRSVEEVMSLAKGFMGRLEDEEQYAYMTMDDKQLDAWEKARDAKKANEKKDESPLSEQSRERLDWW